MHLFIAALARVAAVLATVALASCGVNRAGTFVPAPPGPAQYDSASSATVPMQADAFVDSIGINTHLTQDLTADREFASIVKRMQELGVRHVRDGIFPGQTHEQNADERSFFAMTKTRMMALVDCPKPLGYFPGAQTPPIVIRAFDDHIGGAVELLEGPNEPDLRHVKRWAPLTRTCVGRVDRGRALPVPFVAPAMGFPPNASQLGNIAPLVDIGGIHRYFSGHEPGTAGFYQRNACGRWEAIVWSICEARINAGPTKPLYITETGWTTFGEIDEKTQGKYVGRVLFYDTLFGIARTYLYELHDDGTDPANSEDGYGLFHYDGSPKPAFFAVRNIVRVLADPGPSFQTTPIRIGTQARPTVKTELFEKRDGSYVLAVWNETPSWNPSTNREIAVSPVPVEITFGSSPGGVRFRYINDEGALQDGTVHASGKRVSIWAADRMSFLTFSLHYKHG